MACQCLAPTMIIFAEAWAFVLFPIFVAQSDLGITHQKAFAIEKRIHNMKNKIEPRRKNTMNYEWDDYMSNWYTEKNENFNIVPDNFYYITPKKGITILRQIVADATIPGTGNYSSGKIYRWIWGHVQKHDWSTDNTRSESARKSMQQKKPPAGCTIQAGALYRHWYGTRPVIWRTLNLTHIGQRNRSKVGTQGDRKSKRAPAKRRKWVKQPEKRAHKRNYSI